MTQSDAPLSQERLTEIRFRVETGYRQPRVTAFALTREGIEPEMVFDGPVDAAPAVGDAIVLYAEAERLRVSEANAQEIIERLLVRNQELLDVVCFVAAIDERLMTLAEYQQLRARAQVLLDRPTTTGEQASEQEASE